MKIVSFLERITQTTVDLFPKFPDKLFYLSSVISLFLTLGLSPFFLEDSTRDHIFAGANIQKLIQLARLPFFDPLLIQAITLMVAIIFLVVILKKYPSQPKTPIAYFSPIIIFLTCYLITDYVFKPAFGYTRPPGYSQSGETFLVLFLSRFISMTESAPSGNLVRQIVAVMTLILINTNVRSPLKGHKKLSGLFYTLSVLSVLLVAVQRLMINSHSLFDIVFSLGCGIIIFWLVYVIPYDIHNSNHAIGKVISIYMFFVTTFFFYSNNQKQWIVSSLILMTVLFILDNGLSILRNQQRKPQGED